MLVFPEPETCQPYYTRFMVVLKCAMFFLNRHALQIDSIVLRAGHAEMWGHLIIFKFLLFVFTVPV